MPEIRIIERVFIIYFILSGKFRIYSKLQELQGSQVGEFTPETGYHKNYKMLLDLHPENPAPRKVQQVVHSLQNGGVIIYPTDTVYGIGCDIFHQKAVERVCRIRGLDPAKAMLSFLCKDIAQVAQYAWQLDNDVFRLLKRNLPGPFTFILRSNNTVPRLFKNRKCTIGVRIPNNPITLALVEALGHPILSTSLKAEDDEQEYLTDPGIIYDTFRNHVDWVIDGGPGGQVPSTLVDCTAQPFEIIREGAGVLR
jgi:tRNA threonylcarbamoyl adenosine modification protein (Sua5/YciO/YrdC/YwlC family)